MSRIIPAAVLAALVAGGAEASTGSPSPEEVKCLALNIYFEGRSEPLEGRLAVAHVTLNRVAHPDFPDTICAVVRQTDGEGNCQFSWYCDGQSDEPMEAAAWTQALKVARRAAADRAGDPTGGALFFHGGNAPDWAAEKRQTAAIGEHVFYR